MQRIVVLDHVHSTTILLMLVYACWQNEDVSRILVDSGIS